MIDQPAPSQRQRLREQQIWFPLKRMIKEDLAKELYQSGYGEIFCTEIDADNGKGAYILVFMDNETGPYHVLPSRGLDYRSTPSLPVIKNISKRLGVKGLFKTMELAELLKIEEQSFGAIHLPRDL